MEITDIRGSLIATGDLSTGTVDSHHGDRGMLVPLSEGQTVMLTRKDTVTYVTWSHGDFIIDRRFAA